MEEISERTRNARRLRCVAGPRLKLRCVGMRTAHSAIALLLHRPQPRPHRTPATGAHTSTSTPTPPCAHHPRATRPPLTHLRYSRQREPHERTRIRARGYERRRPRGSRVQERPRVGLQGHRRALGAKTRPSVGVPRLLVIVAVINERVSMVDLLHVIVQPMRPLHLSPTPRMRIRPIIPIVAPAVVLLAHVRDRVPELVAEDEDAVRGGVGDSAG